MRAPASAPPPPPRSALQLSSSDSFEKLFTSPSASLPPSALETPERSRPRTRNPTVAAGDLLLSASPSLSSASRPADSRTSDASGQLSEAEARRTRGRNKEVRPSAASPQMSPGTSGIPSAPVARPGSPADTARPSRSPSGCPLELLPRHTQNAPVAHGEEPEGDTGAHGLRVYAAERLSPRCDAALREAASLNNMRGDAPAQSDGANTPLAQIPGKDTQDEPVLERRQQRGGQQREIFSDLQIVLSDGDEIQTGANKGDEGDDAQSGEADDLEFAQTRRIVKYAEQDVCAWTTSMLARNELRKLKAAALKLEGDRMPRSDVVGLYFKKHRPCWSVDYHTRQGKRKTVEFFVPDLSRETIELVLGHAVECRKYMPRRFDHAPAFVPEPDDTTAGMPYRYGAKLLKPKVLAWIRENRNVSSRGSHAHHGGLASRRGGDGEKAGGGAGNGNSIKYMRPIPVPSVAPVGITFRNYNAGASPSAQRTSAAAPLARGPRANLARYRDSVRRCSRAGAGGRAGTAAGEGGKTSGNAEGAHGRENGAPAGSGSPVDSGATPGQSAGEGTCCGALQHGSPSQAPSAIPQAADPAVFSPGQGVHGAGVAWPEDPRRFTPHGMDPAASAALPVGSLGSPYLGFLPRRDPPMMQAHNGYYTAYPSALYFYGHVADPSPGHPGAGQHRGAVATTMGGAWGSTSLQASASPIPPAAMPASLSNNVAAAYPVSAGQGGPTAFPHQAYSNVGPMYGFKARETHITEQGRAHSLGAHTGRYGGGESEASMTSGETVQMEPGKGAESGHNAEFEPGHKRRRMQSDADGCALRSPLRSPAVFPSPCPEHPREMQGTGAQCHCEGLQLSRSARSCSEKYAGRPLFLPSPVPAPPSFPPSSAPRLPHPGCFPSYTDFSQTWDQASDRGCEGGAQSGVDKCCSVTGASLQHANSELSETGVSTPSTASTQHSSSSFCCLTTSPGSPHSASPVSRAATLVCDFQPKSAAFPHVASGVKTPSDTVVVFHANSGEQTEHRQGATEGASGEQDACEPEPLSSAQEVTEDAAPARTPSDEPREGPAQREPSSPSRSPCLCPAAEPMHCIPSGRPRGRPTLPVPTASLPSTSLPPPSGAGVASSGAWPPCDSLASASGVYASQALVAPRAQSPSLGPACGFPTLARSGNSPAPLQGEMHVERPVFASPLAYGRSVAAREVSFTGGVRGSRSLSSSTEEAEESAVKEEGIRCGGLVQGTANTSTGPRLEASASGSLAGTEEVAAEGTAVQFGEAGGVQAEWCAGAEEAWVLREHDLRKSLVQDKMTLAWGPGMFERSGGELPSLGEASLLHSSAVLEESSPLSKRDSEVLSELGFWSQGPCPEDSFAQDFDAFKEQLGEEDSTGVWSSLDNLGYDMVSRPHENNDKENTEDDSGYDIQTSKVFMIAVHHYPTGHDMSRRH
ncbi:hypothetical protein BESB_043190 [Besnoitia besnoiti]|uniref:AP2 domain transcription factor AP2IV-2 n=1 Tax=Besnoitia besnoiti TaxID=94643 RepID=A0A2A9MKH9_BESBE|nr:hypothetical protein BESB_043190 [Besnoitia besnoiti]PFH36127.1 hypothetical protein BESB_043190 [Besnoitia besnoiti]